MLDVHIRWALNDGIGACMIDKPELIADMIKETRSRIDDPSFSISVKIRIHTDIRFIDICVYY